MARGRLRWLVVTVAFQILVPFALTAAPMPPAPAPSLLGLASAGPGFTLRGPDQARGVVLWSHGRSLSGGDRNVPTPPYLGVLAAAGWDVVRFNRRHDDDTLDGSSRRLAALADLLAGRGYRRVVLAGQSFGAFLSLLAADDSDRVDAVIATAPAAYGSLHDSYATWHENASQLYPLLAAVRRARVMLAFFRDDDYDPGGRAERARAILAGRALDRLILDQPAGLTGHGAAASGLFRRRFGACILRFVEGSLPAAAECDSRWGSRPSKQLLALAGGADRPIGGARHSVLGRWYGTYVNGREVLLTVRRIAGARVDAIYTLGPGVLADQAPERVERRGRLAGSRLRFDEPGCNPLDLTLGADDRLTGAWRSADGQERLDLVLRRLE